MAKEKKENAFMHWYHSYQGKNVVNIVYSAGASVVIVGALFKILHWPGASQVLMIGMFTEAFLFLIGTLEAPHEEFHWGNVFPQLLEFGSPVDRVEAAKNQAKPTLLSANDLAAEKKDEKNVAALSDAELEALNKGIKDLAATAGQLSSLGKVAEQTAKLGEKAEVAAEAAGKFAASAEALGQNQEKLGASYAAVVSEMEHVVDGTKQYGKGVDAANAKLSSLNSVYELQLNALQAQNEALKAQTSRVEASSKNIAAVGDQFAAVSKEVEKIQAANAEILKEHQAYQAATKKLAEQVADLNKIYGNMLNALA